MLKENERAILQTASMREPLSVLEEFAKGDGALHMNIPMEFNRCLSEGLGNGFNIELARCEVSKHHVGAIIVQVRSRLLDFLLELKDGIGDAHSQSVLKEKISSIDTTSLFNNAIFGPNATVMFGSNNTQVVDTAVIQGDFNSLSKRLKALGVDDAAIDELRAAATDDIATADQPSLKQKVSSWIKRQVTKQHSAASSFAVASRPP